MKTILVTGSSGNIGPYILEKIKKLYGDWKVIRVERGVKKSIISRNEEVYSGDLRDAKLLKEIFSKNKINYVIHAASTRYKPIYYKSCPYDIAENDAEMTFSLLRECKNVEKLIYLSSAVVYENEKNKILLEDDLISPNSAYATTKLFCEKIIQSFAIQNNLNYTIWRPFNIVSPLESHVGGGHVFIDLYRKIFLDKDDSIEIYGSGMQRRCFMWVEEAAECIVRSILLNSTDNQIINLARDESINLNELIDMLLSIGKEKNYIDKQYCPQIKKNTKAFFGVDSDERLPSLEKLRMLTNWQAKITVAECFDKFLKEKNGSIKV